MYYIFFLRELKVKIIKKKTKIIFCNDYVKKNCMYKKLNIYI